MIDMLIGIVCLGPCLLLLAWCLVMGCITFLFEFDMRNKSWLGWLIIVWAVLGPFVYRFLIGGN